MTTPDDTTPPPPEPKEDTHYVTEPVPAGSSRSRSRLPWIIAATGLAGLCLGGVIGAGVTTVFTHHRHDRPSHEFIDGNRRGGHRMVPPGDGPFHQPPGSGNGTGPRQPGQPVPSGSPTA